ncbi:MAG: HNH endonuclease, partial [Romboutsia sp.]|nr:HNH endonuclease [Romboutsia sp.]
MYKVCSRCGRVVDYNHKCYKGIVYKKTDIDKLRNTKRWANKSIEIRELSNYLCSVCLDKGIINYNNVEVHHIEK